MGSVIHIAEVAAILAVAYGLGWAIGYLAHRLAALRTVPASVPAERIAAVIGTPDPDALVKAPIIVPVTSQGPPAPPAPAALSVAPEAAPVPPTDTASAPVLIAAPSAASAPDPDARPAAPLLSPVEIPVIATPLPLVIEPFVRPPKPAPIPEPEPEPEPEIVLTATPAARPGEAWSGEVRGKSASPASPPPAPVEVAPAEPPVEIPFTLELSETIAFSAEPEPVVIDQVEPESTPAVAPDEPGGSPEPPPPVEPPAAAPAAPPHDEHAAMRAIEGGWSRVKARALSGAPELPDIGAAVAAAQTAVEQVLARAGIDVEPSQASRPDGLPRPRDGQKDDLKRITGLGSLDESTLNNLGVYYFGQIAGWDEAQVLWMEEHVFARGRIGHENWQQQARELAATGAPENQTTAG